MDLKNALNESKLIKLENCNYCPKCSQGNNCQCTNTRVQRQYDSPNYEPFDPEDPLNTDKYIDDNDIDYSKFNDFVTNPVKNTKSEISLGIKAISSINENIFNNVISVYEDNFRSADFQDILNEFNFDFNKAILHLSQALDKIEYFKQRADEL